MTKKIEFQSAAELAERIQEKKEKIYQEKLDKQRELVEGKIGQMFDRCESRAVVDIAKNDLCVEITNALRAAGYEVNYTDDHFGYLKISLPLLSPEE